MKITKIIQNGDYTALYINGKLFISGDYYHDKINDYISGFVDGISYSGIKFDFELRVFEDEQNEFCPATKILPKYISKLTKKGYNESKT